LNGSESLSPVNGREAELLGVFTVGNNPFGLKIFKNGSADATITYNPSTGMLTADFSRLNRWANDTNSYNGVYSCSLPEFQTAGSELKLNVFIDHSVVDIFINDRWATSIRVFPTDTDANGIEVFSDGAVDVKQVNAWTLSKSAQSGISNVVADRPSDEGPVSIYDLSGHILRRALSSANATEGLTPGIYILASATRTTKLLVK
jgi:beta-fructofuranosidase